MMVVVVVSLARGVAVLERSGDLNGVSRGVGLAWWVAVWWLWLQVRRRRRRARRRRRRRRLGRLELLIGAALHVAQHKGDALARLIRPRRLRGLRCACNEY